MAISTRVFTRNACRRILKAAFEYAEKHGYKSVTVCEKPNVLRETSGMMEEVAREVQKEHPSIQHWSTNIDAQMMWLTKNPEDYGVLVAGNMFGDIVSDAFAGLVGGSGSPAPPTSATRWRCSSPPMARLRSTRSWIPPS